MQATNLIKYLPRNTIDAHLVGYYGMQNSGDDALLAATLWGAQTFLKAERISASTPSHLQLFDQTFAPTLCEQQVFRGQRRLQAYQSAFFSKRLIFGGGSVLHSTQDLQVKRHMMKLSKGHEHIAVGVGIEPFTSKEAETECTRFLNECAFVSVRDQESYNIATSIAPNANITRAFDLAPLLLKNPKFKLQATERMGIAVCLCPHERLKGQPEKEQQRLAEIAESLITIYQQTGEPITLIDFNGHPELGDHQVNVELKSLLNKRPYVPCRIQSYDANPFRVLQRLASYKAIISMRLHGSILGYLARTPLISLNYHNKCRGWCNSIGMPSALSMDLQDINSEALAFQVISGLEHGFDQPRLSQSSAIELALKNWAYPGNESLKFIQTPSKSSLVNLHREHSYE